MINKHKQKIYLSLLTGLNVLLSFATQLVIYTRIGPGTDTDVFVAASTAPQLIAGVVGTALSSVLVPLFSGEEPSSQKENAWTFVYLIGVTLSFFSIIILFTSRQWVQLVFPGFKGQVYELCVTLSRIQIFSILFNGVNAVVIAIHYSRNQFKTVEVVVSISSIMALLIIYNLMPLYGIVVAAWFTLGKFVIQFFLLLPVIGKPHRIHSISPQVRQAWGRMKPMLAGYIYFKSDVLVDRYLLSMGASGELSLFAFAQQIYSAANSIIGKVFGLTAIPRLSTLYKNGDCEEFLRFYWLRMIKMTTLVFLFYITIILIGEPCLRLIAGHGKLSPHNIHTVWMFLILLGGMFIVGCPGVLMSGGYYAIGDTSTPTKLSIISFTFFCIIKIALYKDLGVFGLSVIISLYYCVNALMLLLFFNCVVKKKLLQ